MICNNCIKADVCEVAKEFEKNPVEGMSIDGCEYFKDKSKFIELPCKVKDLIDTIISHNEIVVIWENRCDENGKYHYRLWKGMAHQIPKEYLNRNFDKIFGTVPVSILEADNVNIAVCPVLKSKEEAEQAWRESENI